MPSAQPPDRPPRAARRALLADWAELGKLRLSLLVVATTAAGYAIAPDGRGDIGRLMLAVCGTLLAALGANGLNQWAERERDGRMHRTRERPLPAGRMTPHHAFAVSTAWAVAGVGLLAAFVNLLTAALALGVVLLYVLVYTPLKPRSTLNTLVGAVCGALPPLMGWTAATGALAPGAFVLAGVLFVWQIPHFLALAWLYRDDYERGGYCMLPARDDDGRICSTMVLLYALALVPVALVGHVAGLAGWLYAGAAVLLGSALAATGVLLVGDRSRRSARRVFLASLVYLPLLLAALVADRAPAAPGASRVEARLADASGTAPPAPPAPSAPR
ncbi:MAG: protoheme IX farnesyltransferase [Acidobacteria bacterium]|nr:MAG: protoheme IX farnesyltransferase [Acidobacteriota bacterium]